MSNLNFMIHCGGTEVSRDQLAQIGLPPRTNTYTPIAHNTFADIIQDKLGDAGFTFGEQAHALNREGKQYFGMAELLRGDIQNDDWALVAGWRSSLDKSMAASFVVGSDVFVCDNMAFSGEVQIGRKHTRFIERDLPVLIEQAVSGTKEMADAQCIRYERYQEAEMKDAVVNHTVIQMLRQGIISTNKVEKVINEYYEPSHPEHLKHGDVRTNWTLFNAATEALKGSGLATLPRRTIALHQLVDQATEYALAA